MFYLIFELFFLVLGMFLKEPQLLIAAGAFAIAEELNLRNDGGDDYEA
jgi:hypothetical protein